jgi:hypothetical protein
MWFAGTTGLVFVGAIVGTQAISSPKMYCSPRYFEPDYKLFGSMTHWDGQRYVDIATNGYQYDPHRLSSVAYFPLYPILIRNLMSAAACPPEVAAVLLSNLMFAAAMLLFGRYAAARWGSEVALFCVPLLALFPPTIFMRMGYTESTFMFLSLVLLLMINQGWPIVLPCMICALATALRPVGVALSAVLVIYCWNKSSSRFTLAITLFWAIPLSLLGLIAYTGYLYYEFGDPFVFAKTQEACRFVPEVTLLQKIQLLLTGQPIWSSYAPETLGSWRRFDAELSWWLSIQFANALVFVGTALAVSYGVMKRWLNEYETVLAVLLIGIPYVTRAYEAAMLSQARYMCVVIPAYVVIARGLQNCHRSWGIGVLVLFAFYLAALSALFCAGFLVI